MIVIRTAAIGWSMALQSMTCFAQQTEADTNIVFQEGLKDTLSASNGPTTNNRPMGDLTFAFEKVQYDLTSKENYFTKKFEMHDQTMNATPMSLDNGFKMNYNATHHMNPARANKELSLLQLPDSNSNQSVLDLGLSPQEKEPFFKNRRNVYSSMWAFASLNYLYADLVGIMDKNKLVQYQAGVVEGVPITPKFLTIAAGFMQIPLANVFLPQVIKNERTLRWVQIASGTIMTLVQSGTLFVGKPTPYYALFSTFEIAATTFITIDAIRWKPAKRVPLE